MLERDYSMARDGPPTRGTEHERQHSGRNDDCDRGGGWLAGDRPTFADLAAAAHISVIDYFGDIPWGDFPVAKSWYQRIKSRPSFRTLLADTVRGMAPAAVYADLDF